MSSEAGTASRYTAHVDGETLTIRDRISLDEYSCTLTAELFAPSHTIFKYPVAITIIATMCADDHFTAWMDRETVAIVFNTRQSIKGTVVFDEIEFACRLTKSYTSKDLCAIVASTAVTTHAEKIMAVLAHRILLLESMREKERIFGSVPPRLSAFANAMLETQLADSVEPPFKCLALVKSTLWVAPDRGFDTTIACNTQDSTFNTCLLWIPATFAFLDGYGWNWNRVIPEVRATASSSTKVSLIG